MLSEVLCIRIKQRFLSFFSCITSRGALDIRWCQQINDNHIVFNSGSLKFRISRLFNGGPFTTVPSNYAKASKNLKFLIFKVNFLHQKCIKLSWNWFYYQFEEFYLKKPLFNIACFAVTAGNKYWRNEVLSSISLKTWVKSSVIKLFLLIPQDL